MKNDTQMEKGAAVMERTFKIIIGLTSLAVLALLALRYSSLPEQVPIHFGLDGSVTNSAPRLLFVAAVAAGLLGFNGYVNWFRDPEQPMRFMTVAAYLLVCGGILFSILR